MVVWEAFWKLRRVWSFGVFRKRDVWKSIGYGVFWSFGVVVVVFIVPYWRHVACGDVTLTRVVASQDDECAV